MTSMIEDDPGSQPGSDEKSVSHFENIVLLEDTENVYTSEEFIGITNGRAGTVNSSRTPSLDPSDPEGADEFERIKSYSSLRKKLSKQMTTVDEPNSMPRTVVLEEREVVADPVPITEVVGEKEEVTTGMINRPRQLVRGLALCADDDTKLRAPPSVISEKHPHSMSRESSGTEHTGTDCSGIDLRAFVVATLHKNPRDRQMILGLEQQLIEFVNDSGRQSLKFGLMSSYNRMLIHRVAVMFGLDHNVDNSGQCVVVNKTDRTRLPEFSFSDLIHNNSFTDGHKSARSLHSQEEVDPSMVGYSVPVAGDWWSRRTQSFEANNVISGGHSWAGVRPNARSFEMMNVHQQRNFVDPSLMLKKSGSFGGVPTIYRTGSCHLDERSKIPTRIQNYNSFGSVNHLSSRDTIDEVAENLVSVQLETQSRPPSLPSVHPVSLNTNVANKEIMYAPSPYQQPLYVHASMVSPIPTYSSNINSPITPVSHLMPVHQFGIHPQMLPTHCSPQPILHHVVYGHWNDATYGFIDSSQIPSIPISGHGLPTAAPIPLTMDAQMYYQQYYASQQQSPSYSYPGTTTNMFQSGGMQASVDRGYGSMTQDSVRESDM